MQRSRITNLKSKVANNTKVIENYFFMTALQVINSLFGILIYPYLIRVLGVESYGLFVFALSVTSYFSILISFGFSFPALKMISENKKNQTVKNDVFSAVLTAKIYLAMLSTIIFVVVICSISMFNGNKTIYIINYFQVLSTILFPLWYFQGIQKMKIITYIQLSLRIISLPFTFLLIHNPNDIIKYAIIVTTTNVSSALISIYYLYKVEHLRYHFVTFNFLKNYFIDALPFFWSTSTGTIKEESVNILIGTVFGMKDVALYNLAEKIISIPRMMTMNINSALFPKMIANKEKTSVKKIIRYETLIGFAVIALIILFGKWIVLLLGGVSMINAYPMAIILSVTVLVWLVVGSYINFIFVPQEKFYFVTKNQLVAFISLFAFCIPGLLIFSNIWIIVISLTLSGICEIIYCNYLIKKNNLL
ncbi:MAG: oligosaccharide flippase family protein [Paludibacter sp.]